MCVSSTPWGTFKGKQVSLYTLRDEIVVKVSDYGGTITSIKAPDRHGELGEVVLGFDSLAGYIGSGFYHGATIGRYANRIGGGGFSIDGVRYELPKNDGVNSLHGGTRGFDKHIWGSEIIDDTSLRLSLVSPDSDMGYPGEVTASVVYSVVGDKLEVDYFASTDKPTVVNLANHAYFNLGHRDTILGHRLWIDSDYYTPVNNGLIPTGVLEPVEDTPFDFRESNEIGARINEDNKQLKLGNGYDHNYVLNQMRNPQIMVSEPETGRVLEISTTMPGVQFYTGNFLNGSESGLGRVHKYRSGLCLETQYYPDSPNKPMFPSPVLRPGEKYIEKNVYSFTVMN